MKTEVHELPSEHHDDRGATEVDTLIIHSMYNEFPAHGEELSAEACKAVLDAHTVSAHYLIDRAGAVWRCVPEARRAWHAGRSVLPFAEDPRAEVNIFSIGVELIGSQTSGFTAAQYDALVALTAEIAGRHPLRYILGHNHIAPGRKTDPWNFDWTVFGTRVRQLVPYAVKLPSDADAAVTD